MTRRVTRHDLFRSPANFFALGFGAGLSRYAPGTVGTLAALPVFWLLTALGPTVYTVVVLTAVVAGVKLCARAAESLADGDDGDADADAAGDAVATAADGADGAGDDGDGADAAADDVGDAADASGDAADGADGAAAAVADGGDGDGADATDHPAIVWDEMTGLWVALAFIPPSVDAVVIGVVLFRALDIAKPWPLSLIDRRVKGGLGIMLDDLAAAIAVNLTLRLLAPFLPL